MNNKLKVTTKKSLSFKPFTEKNKKKQIGICSILSPDPDPDPVPLTRKRICIKIKRTQNTAIYLSVISLRVTTSLHSWKKIKAIVFMFQKIGKEEGAIFYYILLLSEKKSNTIIG